jgi:hypothetical protein
MRVYDLLICLDANGDDPAGDADIQAALYKLAGMLPVLFMLTLGVPPDPDWLYKVVDRLWAECRRYRQVVN